MEDNCGTILIVDDDESFRSAVASILETRGFTCAVAGTAKAARARVRFGRPNLVLLDVCLPDMNGYEVCRDLREGFGDALPIIFVSGERMDALDRSAGLLIGADDYIVKPFDPDDLVARIRRQISRSRVVRTLSPSEVGAPTLAPYDGGLTTRERDVLTLLAYGVAPPNIATQLQISEKTVATHLQRVLAKLQVSSRTQAVALAYRNGLVAAVDASDADSGTVTDIESTLRKRLRQRA